MTTFKILLNCLLLLGPAIAKGKKCNNAGLQWAFYNNTSGDNHQANYSAFDPTVYKSQTPLYTGSATIAGGFYGYGNASSLISIYGSPVEFDANYFVLNHQGYIHAPISGSYTFDISSADDIMMLWVGKKAYKNWTRDNADCIAAYSYTEKKYYGCTFSITLRKKQYMPFRLVYGQATYQAFADLTLTAPNGNVLLNAKSAQPSKKRTIVTHGCGKKGKRKAHPFPKFG